MALEAKYYIIIVGISPEDQLMNLIQMADCNPRDHPVHDAACGQEGRRFLHGVHDGVWARQGV